MLPIPGRLTRRTSTLTIVTWLKMRHHTRWSKAEQQEVRVSSSVVGVTTSLWEYVFINLVINTNNDNNKNNNNKKKKNKNNSNN